MELPVVNGKRNFEIQQGESQLVVWLLLGHRHVEALGEQGCLIFWVKVVDKAVDEWKKILWYEQNGFVWYTHNDSFSLYTY